MGTEESNMNKKVIYCLENTIASYNEHLQRLLGYDTDGCAINWKRSNPAHHSFIPTGRIGSLISDMIKVKEYMHSRNGNRNRLKFLDCGCGVGNILLPARNLGYTAAGIEYEADTFVLAKSLLRGHTDVRVIRGNVLYFRHYADYDVIHYYQPLQSDSMRVRFARKLERDVKPGTIIIANGTDWPISESKDFKELFHNSDGSWSDIYSDIYEKVQ